MADSARAQEIPWSISVKTVGGGITTEDNETNSAGEKLFVVTVSPEDKVTSLHDQIEATTGLRRSQQRLIYRGRLIGSSSAPDDKIGDIAGLTDGQTIHLVKKRDQEDSQGPQTQGEQGSSSTSANPRNLSSSLENEILGSAGGNGGSGSLLAALLGLTSLTEEGNNGEEGATTSRRSSRSGWRSRRSRRPHYRMTADDLEVPDPGSMEHVRQGLMTLHTLLPHLQHQDRATPLEANREWFRGQWIDCRDTVNQWLEATIVEIVDPSDILPPRSEDQIAAAASRRHRLPQVANDPAISAGDLDGRRKLLLEPCEAGDAEEEEGELCGFRRRDNNAGVQLLLIHYNGWPHRWDEWIRSDSERIRPFRTRTRHPSVSSTALPTPQSVFNEAPGTSIRNGTESEDRRYLLPELSRAVTVVNDVLNDVVRPAENIASQDQAQEAGEEEALRISEDLPWIRPLTQPTSSNVEEEDGIAVDEENKNCNDNENAEVERSEEDQSVPGLVYRANRTESDSDSSLPDLIPRIKRSIQSDSDSSVSDDDDEEDSRACFGPQERPQHPPYNRAQLQNLATLLDRLGRTLTDAAPHIASLAASLPDEPAPQSAVASRPTNEEAAVEGNDDGLPELEDGSQPPLGGLLSLWSRERRRQNTQQNAETRAVDPDHMDYVSGVVNTSRGEVRSGPRSRSQPDDVASLLGAYLAAASLGGVTSTSNSDDNDNDGDAQPGGTSGIGRILRQGGGGGSGGGGGGIDIHIHAVVTAPGVGPGGLGIATLGGGGGGGGGTLGGGPTIGSTRNLFSSPRDRSTRSSTSILRSRTGATAIDNNDDEDTMGLFSELYSENPTPVDPNGSPEPGSRRSSRPDAMDLGRDDDDDFLARIGGVNGTTGLSMRGEFVPSSLRNRRNSSAERRGSDRRERRSVFGRLFRRRSRRDG